MNSSNFLLASIVAASLSIAGAAAVMPINHACAQKATMSYSEDITPIFKGWCVSCHQPGGEGFKASGLDLTTYQGTMKGTKFGPMVIPRQPDVSNLVVLMRGQAKIRMPLGHKPLPDCLTRNVWSWIFEGAKDN
jgi:Planctomycete cytochrome C